MFVCFDFHLMSSKLSARVLVHKGLNFMPENTENNIATNRLYWLKQSNLLTISVRFVISVVHSSIVSQCAVS